MSGLSAKIGNDSAIKIDSMDRCAALAEAGYFGTEGNKAEVEARIEELQEHNR